MSIKFRLLDIRATLEDLAAEIDELLEHIETGPENSREEVSPMDRSPQRDCCTTALARSQGAVATI